MIDTIEASGSCLCGSIKVEVKTLSTKVGACHCATCRKWSGGPLLAVDCGSDVTFTQGQTLISVFSSSDWAERGFCSQCGGHLFYRLKHSGQHIIPVGVFNLDAELDFDHQIFIDSKPAYYCFSNETKNMTGVEVFAQANS